MLSQIQLIQAKHTSVIAAGDVVVVAVTADLVVLIVHAPGQLIADADLVAALQGQGVALGIEITDPGTVQIVVGLVLAATNTRLQLPVLSGTDTKHTS